MTRRMLISEMWVDDFFVSLTLTYRLIWIGLITACADDQGRFQDNANLVKSKVFPLDTYNADDIEVALKQFCKANKIVRYTVNGKKCIQIVSWWKHQTPQWAGHSLLPAPSGWTDRERYHGKGNKIITINWDNAGGYIADYEALSRSSDGDVNGDVNVNGDVEEPSPNLFIEKGIEEYQRVFEKDTGIKEYNILEAEKIWSKMKAEGVTPQDMHMGTQNMLHAPNKSYTISRPQSVQNAAHTAKNNRIMNEINNPPKPKIQVLRDSNGEYMRDEAGRVLYTEVAAC